ncbi:hypothetical protein D9757_008805 [Collybiopsis confluens]|uniref:DUF6534 domain-containing protein n=1 Tax=Collybiopsis confluens TaxID=2823264 RepID=A0A8H5H5U2_9AGAR|nr:hypothetical protein D9757_008805 [Collybiopsis confluens]
MSVMSSSLGSVLAGCMAAVGLSAVLGFQTFLYFHIFPSDSLRYKILVAWIWVTDALHTILICTSVWHYLILDDNLRGIVEIYPTIPVTIMMTAIITLSVNSFYGWRIYKLSKRNWWLTAPIILGSAVRRPSCPRFRNFERNVLVKNILGFWTKSQGKSVILFTSGLCVSALTDVIVSVARYHYLKALRQGYSQTQEIVDSVVVFTINDGVLTCAVVIASIAFWLGMPHNFVYLGIYFTISKSNQVYSNSVLATLNLRDWYRHQYAWPGRALGLSVMQPAAIREGGAHSIANRRGSEAILPVPADSAHINKSTSPDLESGQLEVEVFVARQVEYDTGSFGGHVGEAESDSKKATEIPSVV